MTRIEIATRLYAAAISNPGLLHQTAEHLRHSAIIQADALLAECGEGEATQPREIEWSLSASLLKQLVDVINHTNDRDMIDRITESVAFKVAEKYVNGIEVTQPRKVEVTVVERLLEDLLDTIDDFGEKEHIEDLRETDAMQCALEYVKANYQAINGDDA